VNVAQLAALVVALGLIASGFPRGCGSELEEIPLDVLPGEPVETAALPPVAPPPRLRAEPRPTARRPPRDQRRRRPRPPRRRGLGREVVARSVSAVRVPPRAPSRRPHRHWLRVPEAAREFSFDR